MPKLTREALLAAGWEERRTNAYYRRDGHIYVYDSAGSMMYGQVSTCHLPPKKNEEIRGKFVHFKDSDAYSKAVTDALAAVGRKKMEDGRRVADWALSKRVLQGVPVHLCTTNEHAAMCKVSDPLYLFMEQVKNELWITRGYGIAQWNRRAPTVWLVSESDMRRDVCLDKEGWANRPEQPF